MSSLEERALPTLAAMIRGEHVSVTPDLREDLASWSVAAAIVRGEMDKDLKSFDIDVARAFRFGSLTDANVQVWAVNTERTVDTLSVWPIGHTYFNDTDLSRSGQVVVFWLRSVCIVVASAEHAQLPTGGLRLLGSAALQLWPTTPFKDEEWPRPRSVSPRVALRGMGVGEGMYARQALDLRDAPKGRLTNHIFRVPSGPATQTHHELVAQNLASRLRRLAP